MTGIMNVILGTGGATITVSGHTITHTDSGGAQAEVEFLSSGTVLENLNNDGIINQIDSDTDWIRPTHLASGAHQIRATVVSGSVDIGDSTGTWLALDSQRNWGVFANPGNMSSVELLIEIGSGNGSTIYDSGTYTITADAT